jgi:hypothetical protein
MVGVGSVSYSAYLWHQPLLAFARIRALKAPGHPLMWMLSGVSLVIAFFSAKYIEQPFRDRQRTRRRTILIGALAASASFVVIGAVGVLNDGFPSRLPAQARSMLQVEADHRKQRDDGGCNVAEGPFTQLAGCAKGRPGTMPDTALWGDSHAAALVGELARAFDARGGSFVQVTKNSCPAGVGLTNAITDDILCDQYEANSLDYLIHSPVHTVIVASRWQFYLEDSAFDNGEGGVEFEVISSGVRGFTQHHDESRRVRDVEQSYREAIVALLDAGKHVILVYPDPEQGWNVPEHLARILMFGDAEPSQLSVSHSHVHERLRRATAALDAIADRPGLTRVKPEAVFCSTFVADRCVGQVDGTALYYDDDHYSNDGARLVVERIMQAMVPLTTAARPATSAHYDGSGMASCAVARGARRIPRRTGSEVELALCPSGRNGIEFTGFEPRRGQSSNRSEVAGF